MDKAAKYQRAWAARRVWEMLGAGEREPHTSQRKPRPLCPGPSSWFPLGHQASGVPQGPSLWDAPIPRPAENPIPKAC